MNEKEVEKIELAQVISSVSLPSIHAAQSENKILISHLELIDDAIKHYAVNDWMPLRSVIESLTEKNELKKITEEVMPESKFHKNPKMVAVLAELLRHWLEESWVNPQDSLKTLSNILRDRLTENERLLKSFGFL